MDTYFLFTTNKNKKERLGENIVIPKEKDYRARDARKVWLEVVVVLVGRARPRCNCQLMLDHCRIKSNSWCPRGQSVALDLPLFGQKKSLIFI